MGGLVKQSLTLTFNTEPNGIEVGKLTNTILFYISYVQFNNVDTSMKFKIQAKLLPGKNLPLAGNANYTYPLLVIGLPVWNMTLILTFYLPTW